MIAAEKFYQDLSYFIGNYPDETLLKAYLHYLAEKCPDATRSIYGHLPLIARLFVM